ncbi:ferric-chelate reductase 1 isoform X2 [Varanus komodoensis]|uniref:Ferric chelate reductase 1 n=2 Tax=Varanus komodoensis TaxID=61221 RepID=A0A8D2J8N6_VARKO|nr:ferric-chelate reductase 1 isoform X2 [Varanus komodoensis]XP_044288549.1 ferric-chelate reductase 1 isoform X2 [Varanus komodoensis]XP_044288550.1 ferric-chelate reductase 1 isoform X2 [Varanus komodoensis]XP_044288552.1 ferric-chelate reductase 1 isoform X2 [Varanus komodoensis]XP_044288553.1 ferric-chelate reductase 1 isoform X2 [Varanus komodoensis]
MESSGILLAVLVLVCLSGPSAGYPNGKVKEACNNMMPLHGHSPQKLPKHTIEVNVTEFKPGDHVQVSLSGPPFEGFFLQARNAENVGDPAIGSFVLADKRQSQLLTCGHTKNSAVSHTSKSKKTHLDAYWIAPRDAPKRIQFLVTVVEKYSIFWVKVPGPIISQPNTPILRTTIGTLPTSSLVPHLTHPFNASDCGKKKFCVRNPSNCDPQENTCFFLSFTRDHDTVLVEMSGPSEGYIAFTLSHDQWMGGGDDAYICGSENRYVDISTASLVGRAYPEFDSEDALEEKSWRLADGVIQCSFKRRIHLPSSKRRFKLDASYYIFMADGEVGEGGIIQKHHRQPLITNAKYNISGLLKDIGGSRSPFLIKIHGALMFVAWMATVSIGVIVARYFKPVWPNSLLFGREIWFQVHRMLMMTTVLLTSASFILPFVYRGGWSEQAGFHPYFGCTVMALAIFQPIMAGFRPPPQAPRRQIFNWLHWSTGTTARILAVITIFMGMDLPALNLPDPWDTYTMLGFVAWHVGIDLILEIHGYCLIRKVEVLEDDRIQILQSVTTAEAQGHTFKKTVLFLYICGNIAFLIAFLTAIVQI